MPKKITEQIKKEAYKIKIGNLLRANPIFEESESLNKRL